MSKKKLEAKGSCGRGRNVLRGPCEADAGSRVVFEATYDVPKGGLGNTTPHDEEASGITIQIQQHQRFDAMVDTFVHELWHAYFYRLSGRAQGKAHSCEPHPKWFMELVAMSTNTLTKASPSIRRALFWDKVSQRAQGKLERWLKKAKKIVAEVPFVRRK